nr:hypothetical protein Itr_chr01CG03440 [Ipomoea trifida]
MCYTLLMTELSIYPPPFVCMVCPFSFINVEEAFFIINKIFNHLNNTLSIRTKNINQVPFLQGFLKYYNCSSKTHSFWSNFLSIKQETIRRECCNRNHKEKVCILL